MPANRARENNLFQVTAFLNQIFDGIAVGDADDILFDDGAVVENLGDIVTGGADQLDAAGECLVIGPGPDESGKNEW